MRNKGIVAALIAVAVVAGAGEGQAYTYASPQSDPLIKGREAYLAAVNKGDWAAVETAYKGFTSDITQLSQKDVGYAGDPDLDKAFTDAIANKDADAAKAALRRATVDQIDRRLSGAQANVKTYQTCSTLVVTAEAFSSAMAGDLSSDDQKTVSGAMQSALDACGKPGVFGYGAKPADPDALKNSTQTIMTMLKGSDAGATAAPSAAPTNGDGAGQ
ncbi:hypothetical protein [Amorphus sp. 3PC139-8]|uniref:hypothetical protein n=1 Tax=Amorphus sp. 3PC139-8 TaxID=2735676 RepID=UPI00345DA941